MNTAIMQEFEDFIVASAPKVESFHPHYQKALWEMLLAGGKRFRPALCLCVVDSIAPQMLKNAFIPALALEALHTYSLIHDDLPCMDNSPLRRGYPTLHTTYDETLALLVGDALNTYAFELLSTAKLDPQSKIALIYELSHNAGFSGMVLGQVLDCAFENTTLSLEQLKMIHQNKTLKLIATSLRFGAIIGNASDEIRQCLDRFGEVLGLFFQVRDDLLDVLGDTLIEGKTLHNDVGKNTYVNLLGIEGAKKECDELIESMRALLTTLPKSLATNLLGLIEPYFVIKG
ncbi:polyprenyl synthetase family protein [Helicobacter sp. TUL]|uniref:polyprenyl synthetase family protein n=1 Tax=Helicobacter sp. TUL TaxID=1848928 RepID=UPI000BABD7D9|nr:polyprenyl synthetase family protein [Helicobacter sp. TUL]PAU99380.1 geranyl transferase [Helicobacter sp. TUL]